jgi:fructuronate reductase
MIGASLRSADTRDALLPQDGLYTLAVRSAREALRVIGAIQNILVAPEDPEALLAAMADPRVRIVSLTVTERAIATIRRRASSTSASRHRARSAEPRVRPRSAPGLVVAALARRRAEGTAPFTLLTCDNLPSNGRVAKRIVDRFAQLRDADLGAYVAAELACPSTMVDRITPATTDEDRARVAAALGAVDAWPIVTEPFTQWAIEDYFPTGRPAWENAGAELVS